MTKEIKGWSKKQFEAMSDNKRLSLNIDDMKAVREIAFTRFGYMFYVAKQVKEAFDEFKTE